MSEINLEQFMGLEQCICKPEILSFNGLDIEVKKYTTDVTKTYIANMITSIYFLEKDEDTSISYKDLKNSLMVNSIISNYTNINLGDSSNYSSICNIAIQTGLYDKLLEIIPTSEITMLKERIEDSIQNKKDEIALENSVELQLKRFLEMALSKIPTDKGIITMVKTLKKEFNGFKPEKYPIIAEMAKALGGKDVPNPKDVADIGENILKQMGIKQ